MRTNTLFRLATGVFVLVVALQLQAEAQEKGKETPGVPPKAASQPACVDCPGPSFPSEARRARIESGTVLLEITVSEKGRPSDIQVLSDPGNGFAREAVAAVKHWKFKPAITRDGRKISTRVKIEVVSHQM